ncbi:MAG: hypothetical protein Q9204_003667 [Flavoplaca sp. TL-2023a]
MSSQSLLKTLSLLVLIFPIFISSAPSPEPQAPAAAPSNLSPPLPPPDQYNISVAEYRRVAAIGRNYDVEVPAQGENNTLSFTVSGVKPGNTPINWFGMKWFFDPAKNLTLSPEWLSFSDDEQPLMSVRVFEVAKPTPETVNVWVEVQYGDLAPATWFVATNNATAWACDVGGAVCTLKDWIIIESDPLLSEAETERQDAALAEIEAELRESEGNRG